MSETIPVEKAIKQLGELGSGRLDGEEITVGQLAVCFALLMSVLPPEQQRQYHELADKVKKEINGHQSS